MRLFRIWGCCLLLTSSTIPVVVADTPTPEEVLQQLQSFDSIYESGFTVAGRTSGQDEIKAGKLWLATTRKWRLTFGGDRVGYVMHLVDHAPPSYLPPRRPTVLPPGQKLPDDTFRFPLRTTQWGYWGHDLSGNHYQDEVVHVSPDGGVKKDGLMHNSSVFGPADDGPLAPRREALWSLGRFFSGQVTRVTEVEEREGGLLQISADGIKSQGQNGKWQFVVEPAAAWMIRSAEFYWDLDSTKVNVAMRNEGTVWNGPFCIPSSAEINHWGSLDSNDPDVKRVTFDPEVEPFDEALYKETQEAVVNNQRPTLTVHDHRVSPPAITEPFRVRQTTAPAPSPNFRRIFLWAMNAVLLLLIGLALWYRRIRSRSVQP